MTQPQSTFYDTLGVDSNASHDDIKAAFRTRVKTDHPDRKGSRLDFERTITARDVLLDEEQRELYDDIGHERYCNLKDIPEYVSGTEPAQNATTPSKNTPARTTTPSTSTSSSSTQTTTSTSTSSSTNRTTAHASRTNTGPTTDQQTSTNTNSDNASTEQTSTAYATARSFSFPSPTLGIHSFTDATRKIGHAMGWFVETSYRSMIAVHYGLFALLVSSLFIGTLAYNAIPMYVKIPSGILLAAMWGYMVLDWKLGVSGFLSAILLTTYDLNNTQFNPFIEHYEIITAALTIGLAASFAMKLYYDRNGVHPRSVMPKLAGWDESRTR